MFERLLLISALFHSLKGWMPQVEEYFRVKSVTAYEAIACSEREAAEMMRMTRDNQLSIRRISTKFVVPSFSGQMLGIFVNGHCETNLNLILRASEDAWESGNKWLILVPSNLIRDPIGFPAGVNLSLGIFSDVTLVTDDGRFYSLRRNSGRVKMTEIGHWDFKRRLELKETDGRIDLNKTVFTGAIVYSVPIYNKGNETNEMVDDLFHPGLDIANRNVYSMSTLIAGLFNFSLELVETDRFGSFLPGGRFDGLMGMLQRREINMSVTPLLPIATRLNAAYATMTLQEFGLIFALKQPKKLGAYSAMILEFSPAVWACVAVTIATGGIVLCIAQYPSPNRENYIGFLQAVASVTCQGLIVKMTKSTSRIASLTLLVFGALLLNYYGGSAMTSLLTPAQISIRGLKDLLNGKLKLFFLETAFLKDPKARGRIFAPELMTAYDRGEMKVRALHDGMNEIRRGNALCGENFVLYRTINQNLLDHEKCDLIFINAAISTSAVSYLQKNTHLREMIMRGFLRLQEHGLKRREHDRWIGEKPKCLGKTVFLHVHLEAVSIALVIYFTGLILSLITLTVQLIVERLVKKKTKRSEIMNLSWRQPLSTDE